MPICPICHKEKSEAEFTNQDNRVCKRCNECRYDAIHPRPKFCLYCHQELKTDYKNFCNSFCEFPYYQLRNKIIRTLSNEEIETELAKLKTLGKNYYHEKINPKTEDSPLGLEKSKLECEAQIK